jgi:uncharacterized protein
VSIEGITDTDIANYLANNPAFFERHAELLSSIHIKSPHRARTISLQERQMEMLRDKIKGLEAKIIEMIRYGQDNSRIVHKLHQWLCTLARTPVARDLPEVLSRELAHAFRIPQVSLRLWGLAEVHAQNPFAAEVSEELKTWVADWEQPLCGSDLHPEPAQWLPEPAAVQSLALIPLKFDNTPNRPFGLLVLASPDPTRYAAEMGVEFLTQIGELSSACLSRLLPQGSSMVKASVE